MVANSCTHDHKRRMGLVFATMALGVGVNFMENLVV